MLKFNDAGSVKKVSGTDYWLVDEPFKWQIIYGLDSSKDIAVPSGFRTNFGSIPRCFWWVMNPTEWNSYVLHDFLYSTHYENNRDTCDYILYEALVAEGCNKIIAMIIYLVLVCFGKKSWDKSGLDLPSA